MKQKRKISASLDENLNYYRETFKGDNTVKVRTPQPYGFSSIRVGIVFIDGLINDLIVNQNIVAPVLGLSNLSDLNRSDFSSLPSGEDLFEMLKSSILFGDDISETGDLDQLTDAVLLGDTLLFCDGSPSAMIIASKGWAVRSVSEPDSERVITGPHEGFTESIMMNLSMVRRRITDKALKYEFYSIGKKSKTVVCVCYMDGLADRSILKSLRKRIKAINIDCILDTEYIEEIIKDGRYSLFKTTGSTERPDIVAAKLLEGRVAMLVNGSPVATTLPYVFIEYFQSGDDYYCDAYYASFNRLLRFSGFFISLSLPAIYLSLITFHQEMLPLKFLMSAASSRNGMPMSSFAEMLILILIFELIREGSAKIPSSIGTAFSIVGGIVLGQASVEAHFVSLPIVIIVAFTGITGLIVPQLRGPVLYLRFILLFLSYMMGLFGYMLGILYIIFSVCSIRSFSIQYTSLTSRDVSQTLADTFVRLPWNKMKKRPAVTDSDDVIRQRNDKMDSNEESNER